MLQEQVLPKKRTSADYPAFPLAEIEHYQKLREEELHKVNMIGHDEYHAAMATLRTKRDETPPEVERQLQEYVENEAWAQFRTKQYNFMLEANSRVRAGQKTIDEVREEFDSPELSPAAFAGPSFWAYEAVADYKKHGKWIGAYEEWRQREILPVLGWVIGYEDDPIEDTLSWYLRPRFAARLALTITVSSDGMLSIDVGEDKYPGSNVVVRVDENTPVRWRADTNPRDVFEQLIDQFKKGKKALTRWQDGPENITRDHKVDLEGFTESYEQLKQMVGL